MGRYLIVIGASWGSAVWTRLNDDRIALVTHLEDVADWTRYRFAFLLNYSHRVPDDVLAQCEVVNFHCFGPAGGPWHRGGGPIENLIRLGYRETIIGAHRVTSEMDAGPVYAVSEPVSLDGTKEQILARFVEPVADMIRVIIETEPVPVPQVGEVVTFRRLPPDEFTRFWEARARG